LRLLAKFVQPLRGLLEFYCGGALGTLKSKSNHLIDLVQNQQRQGLREKSKAVNQWVGYLGA
jgi:hypothetical protein